MKCEEASERITALVDGELPPAEREELERHLAGCPACREARAAEEAVAARLRAAARPPLPPGFTAGVMAKVGSAPATAAGPAGRILPLWPLFAAGGAVAAAAVLMVMVGPGRDRGTLDTTLAEVSHAEARKPSPSGAPVPLPGPTAGPAAPSSGAGSSGGSLDAELKKGGSGVGGSGAGPGPNGRGRAGYKPSEESEAAGAAPAPAAKSPPPVDAAGPEEDKGAGTRPGAKAEAPLEEGRDDAGKPAGSREDREKGRAEGETASSNEPAGGKSAGDEAAGSRTDRSPAPEAPVQETRLVLRIGVKSLSEGVQAVERALILNRDAATRFGNWKDAPEASSPEDRREQKDGGAPAARRKEAGPPGERVLEVRVRRADVGRVVGDLPPGEYAVSGPALPPEVTQVLRDRLERIQGAAGAAGAFADGKQKAPAKEASPPEGGVARPTPPDTGGGTPTPDSRTPQDPQPPPAPTPEQLHRLAEPPTPSREKSVKGAATPEEVVVEIHLQAEGK